MTAESVISATAAQQAASLFGQKVNEVGCPAGTRDGEDGGDAGRIEHDAVGLQSGCQRGVDFFDIDLPGNEIVHAHVVSIRRAGGMLFGVGPSGYGYTQVAAMAADQKRVAVVATVDIRAADQWQHPIEPGVRPFARRPGRSADTQQKRLEVPTGALAIEELAQRSAVDQLTGVV